MCMTCTSREIWGHEVLHLLGRWRLWDNFFTEVTHLYILNLWLGGWVRSVNENHERGIHFICLLDHYDIKMSATNENTTLLNGKKKINGVSNDVDYPTDMTGISCTWLWRCVLTESDVKKYPSLSSARSASAFVTVELETLRCRTAN
jgi:hypothetical protein